MVLVNTTEENKELWNWIGFLRDEHNAARLIERRINNNFFLNPPPATLAPLTTANVKRAARRVASAIRQAEELWRAAGSEGVTAVSVPVLLFYGAESLAAALIFGTFDTEQHSTRHGLKSEAKHRRVLVQNSKNELFRRFHDCYSADGRVYNTKWTLKQLLSVNIDVYQEFSLGYRAAPHINLGVDHIDTDRELRYLGSYWKPYRRSGKRIPLHPLDYRFLTLFVVSSFARYEPTEWIRFLESPAGFVTRAFLAKTYRRFPNLFLNVFWGEEFIFAPVAKIGGPPQMPAI